jgi:predicted anti-sigma-YlaC factor YlaD
MNRIHARLLLLAIVGVLLMPALSEAQLTRGIVSGTVRDQTGGLVPGAVATATNVETGVARTGVTNEQGFYRIPALEPGRYTVRIDLSGFKTVERTGVTVPISTEVTVSVALEVATLGEAVTVTAEAEAVQLSKSTRPSGRSRQDGRRSELPLSAARNVDNLSPLPERLPGARLDRHLRERPARRGDNFTIDGSDNNDISVTLRTSPVIPEAVAEFQVQTNPYNVEFGRNSGGQINVITKSGTNAFHNEA